MAFITGPALPSTRQARTSSTCSVTMSAANKESKTMSRRALMAGVLAAATAASLPQNAFAEREYPNVGFLGGGEQIDINNANVRAYQKLRGFYPTLAGIIVSNGPYKSVDDLYNLPDVTDTMREVLDSNKDKLVALDPAAEYVIDKFNNGLYR